MGSESGAPVEVGEVVAGKYRIDRLLGTGGMGVVLAATQVDLDRRVAIKFLLPAALKNSEVVARFAREARSAARIQSEHVARVIDVGVLPTGAPYMVMEYLDGADLAQRISTGERLSLGEAVRYVLEACEALAEAHAAGIVHRDLKPANLFLARRPDRTSSVKVLDFGISKSPVGDGGITRTQAVMGSPLYMSPEQLVSAKRVDHRTDIWSLGIVLFEALTGATPFVADTMPEIVAQILTVPTPSVCAVRPDLPAQVDALLGRCLAKEPGARFKDVAELARALAPFARDGARSVERVARVLGEDGGVPHPEGPASLEGTPSRADIMPVAVTEAAARSEASWGATQPAGVPRRRSVRALSVAAVGGGAIVAVAIAAFVGLHGSRARESAGTAGSGPQPRESVLGSSIPSSMPAREPDAVREPKPAAAETLARLPEEIPPEPSAVPTGAPKQTPNAAPVAASRHKAAIGAGSAAAPSAASVAPPQQAPQAPAPTPAPTPTNALSMPFK